VKDFTAAVYRSEAERDRLCGAQCCRCSARRCDECERFAYVLANYDAPVLPITNGPQPQSTRWPLFPEYRTTTYLVNEHGCWG
jgi:hypothetical protein